MKCQAVGGVCTNEFTLDKSFSVGLTYFCSLSCLQQWRLVYHQPSQQEKQKPTYFSFDSGGANCY